jgi:hypothetical protein
VQAIPPQAIPPGVDRTVWTWLPADVRQELIEAGITSGALTGHGNTRNTILSGYETSALGSSKPGHNKRTAGVDGVGLGGGASSSPAGETTPARQKRRRRNTKIDSYFVPASPL